MRYYYNGAGYTVTYNERDSSDFAGNWPCSTVEGKGYWSFGNNGDLVDSSGSNGDGPDWLVFSQDCKNYGWSKFEKDQRNGCKRAYNS